MHSNKKIDQRKLRQKSLDGEDNPTQTIPSSSASSAIRSHSPKNRQSPGILRSAFSFSEDSHHVSEDYFEKQAQFSAITYLPLNNQIYRFFTLKQGQAPKLDWHTWFIMAIIGLFTGLCGATLKYVTNKLNELKYHFVGVLIRDHGLGVTWVVFILISILCVLISTLLVLFIHPQAAGSGIPEIICYLNGVSIRHVFTCKALMIKFLSCVFALAAGLYGGSEGPMIHMGAAIGKIVSQGVFYKFLGWEGELVIFKRLKTMQHRRHFISAGCAAGIASAFFAPIGGLLFLFEEISSFYSKKLGWQTFLCCLIATEATTGFLGLYQFMNEDVQSEWQISALQLDILQQLTLYIPTIIVGVICGLYAALFTWFLTKIVLPSKAYYLGNDKRYRIAEAVLLAAVTSTGALLIPLLFKCRNCEEAVHLEVCTEEMTFEQDGKLTYQMYQCGNNSEYNPAATLFVNTADEEISYLLSRGTSLSFPPTTVLAMLLFYTFMCCVTIGSSPSLGTMVPALVIGSLLGRLIGLGVSSIDNNHDAWADPGVFALIGAAAFFGGLTRLTFSVVVIIIEVTGETYLIVPTAFAVMVGKWTADYLTESMYHEQIHLKCIPFIDDEPHTHGGENLDLCTVDEIMAKDVVCLKEISTVAEVATTLLSHTSHDAFPIVQETENNGEVFKGIVRRNHVYSLLEKEQAFMNKSNPVISTGRRGSIDINESSGIIASAFLSSLNEDDIQSIDDKIPMSLMAKTKEQRLKRLRELATQEQHKSQYVVFSPYLDSCSYSIPSTFSILRAHSLLRNMCLTHITVVNKLNNVVGILTRKDLLSDSIQRALHHHDERIDHIDGVELIDIEV